MTIEAHIRRVLPSLLSRQVTVPEIIEQPEDLFVLGRDDENSDKDIDRRQDIREGPQKVGFDIVENDTGEHVVDHVDRHHLLIVFRISEGVVDGLLAGVIKLA